MKDLTNKYLRMETVLADSEELKLFIPRPVIDLLQLDEYMSDGELATEAAWSILSKIASPQFNNNAVVPARQFLSV